MFSATKFVVAGAIVALFGGFLLSGVLTQQPSDEPLPPAAASASASPEADATATPEEAARADILPGVDLITEEVEPGVYRVLSDGVRDLPWMADDAGRPYSGVFGAIVVAPDGAVWNFTWPADPGGHCRRLPNSDAASCLTFYRLGAPDTHRMEAGSALTGGINAGMDQVDVTQDGTVWAVVGRGSSGRADLRSFDGEGWTVRRRIADGGSVHQLAVGGDGRVWASWIGSGGRWRLGRLTEEGWSSTELPVVNSRPPYLVADPGGEVYLVELDGAVRRVDGLEQWPFVAWADTDIGAFVPRAGGGMVWWVTSPYPASNDLVRFDGSEQVRFDVVPDDHYVQVLGVDANGAAWLAGQMDQRGCDGIIRHDGTEARHFLAGSCPVAFDFAPDGSVWLQVLGSSDLTVEIYVITPDAVAE